jgi:hypothetical protein
MSQGVANIRAIQAGSDRENRPDGKYFPPAAAGITAFVCPERASTYQAKGNALVTADPMSGPRRANGPIIYL